VIDFRSMSDEAVLRYMKQASGRVCGKFHPSQLDRPIRERPVRSRWGIASLLGLLSLGPGLAQAQSGTNSDSLQTDHRAYSYLIHMQASADSPKLIGKVVDSQGKPLAWVPLFLENSSTGTFTNDSGIFELLLPTGHKNLYESALVKVSYMGYRPIQKHLKPNQFELIQLEEEEPVLEEILVIGGQVATLPHTPSPRGRLFTPFRRIQNWLRRRH
ncbi:MAG: carboxypeptidase-like regulatory domain-containing protein, partial [Bacteroidota bacterium]